MTILAGMTGVLDLSLIASARSLGVERLAALTLHYERLKRYPMYLVWCEDFTGAFYSDPPKDRDLFQVACGLLGYLQGNNRLVTLLPARQAPTLFPDVAPSFAADLGPLWVDQVGAALCAAAWVEGGLGFLTCARADLAGRQRVDVTNAAAIGSLRAALPVLRESADWAAFLQTYLRPDLTGKRVAVLGGRRDQFERATAALRDGYHLEECRWLPPAYVEIRTKKQTVDRLQRMDVVVVCTTGLKHTDTDHLNAELPCARQDVHEHSMNAIVRTVLDHFRAKELARPGK